MWLAFHLMFHNLRAHGVSCRFSSVPLFVGSFFAVRCLLVLPGSALRCSAVICRICSALWLSALLCSVFGFVLLKLLLCPALLCVVLPCALCSARPAWLRSACPVRLGSFEFLSNPMCALLFHDALCGAVLVSVRILELAQATWPVGRGRAVGGEPWGGGSKRSVCQVFDCFSPTRLAV